MFWPAGADAVALVAFRDGPNAVRDHSNVPLTELASLASDALAEGADDEETIRRIALRFELGRLRSATRGRFEAAVALARGHHGEGAAGAGGSGQVRSTDEPYDQG